MEKTVEMNVQIDEHWLFQGEEEGKSTEISTDQKTFACLETRIILHHSLLSTTFRLVK